MRHGSCVAVLVGATLLGMESTSFADENVGGVLIRVGTNGRVGTAYEDCWFALRKSDQTYVWIMLLRSRVDLRENPLPCSPLETATQVHRTYGALLGPSAEVLAVSVYSAPYYFNGYYYHRGSGIRVIR